MNRPADLQLFHVVHKAEQGFKMVVVIKHSLQLIVFIKKSEAEESDLLLPPLFSRSEMSANDCQYYT